MIESLKAIVDASYTFKDVVWYCWITAVVVGIACLLWHEFSEEKEN